MKQVEYPYRTREYKETNICLGHLTLCQSPEGWCPMCLEDEFNEDCPYYRKTKIWREDGEEEKRI